VEKPSWWSTPICPPPCRLKSIRPAASCATRRLHCAPCAEPRLCPPDGRGWAGRRSAVSPGRQEDPDSGRRGNRPVKPEKPNGIKFEMFVFDALPYAARPLVIETLRADDFSPVKNAEGVDSPQTCGTTRCGSLPAGSTPTEPASRSTPPGGRRSRSKCHLFLVTTRIRSPTPGATVRPAGGRTHRTSSRPSTRLTAARSIPSALHFP
jgi:hypothetical protein